MRSNSEPPVRDSAINPFYSDKNKKELALLASRPKALPEQSPGSDALPVHYGDPYTGQCVGKGRGSGGQVSGKPCFASPVGRGLDQNHGDDGHERHGTVKQSEGMMPSSGDVGLTSMGRVRHESGQPVDELQRALEAEVVSHLRTQNAQLMEEVERLRKQQSQQGMSAASSWSEVGGDLNGKLSGKNDEGDRGKMGFKTPRSSAELMGGAHGARFTPNGTRVFIPPRVHQSSRVFQKSPLTWGDLIRIWLNGLVACILEMPLVNCVAEVVSLLYKIGLAWTWMMAKFNVTCLAEVAIMLYWVGLALAWVGEKFHVLCLAEAVKILFKLGLALRAWATIGLCMVGVAMVYTKWVELHLYFLVVKEAFVELEAMMVGESACAPMKPQSEGSSSGKGRGGSTADVPCRWFKSDAGCRAGKQCKWSHSWDGISKTPDRLVAAVHACLCLIPALVILSGLHCLFCLLLLLLLLLLGSALCCWVLPCAAGFCLVLLGSALCCWVLPCAEVDMEVDAKVVEEKLEEKEEEEKEVEDEEEEEAEEDCKVKGGGGKRLDEPKGSGGGSSATTNVNNKTTGAATPGASTTSTMTPNPKINELTTSTAASPGELKTGNSGAEPAEMVKGLKDAIAMTVSQRV
ncbi:unnamed protein product, partial [Cladocopium goreaui]